MLANQKLETSPPVPVWRTQVEQFAAWYLTAPGMGVPQCVEGEGIRQAGCFTGLTLFRQDRFQVQMWICPPNSHIPDHSHPGVNNVQVLLSGQVYLRHNGVLVLSPEEMQTAANVGARVNGTLVVIMAGETHGAEVGPLGGAFLSIQHWLHEEPTSVELNWDGPPLAAGAHQVVGPP